MHGVWCRTREWVVENCACLGKRDPMPLEIALCLLPIPLESEAHDAKLFRIKPLRQRSRTGSMPPANLVCVSSPMPTGNEEYEACQLMLLAAPSIRDLITKDARLPAALLRIARVCRLAAPRRRDRQLEPVRVPQPEDARAPRRVGGLRVEGATALFDPSRDVVDALLRRDLQRATLAFDAIPALLAVVLIDQDPHVASAERYRPEFPVALVPPLDRETHHLVVPGQALREVLHGE